VFVNRSAAALKEDSVGQQPAASHSPPALPTKLQLATMVRFQTPFRQFLGRFRLTFGRFGAHFLSIWQIANEEASETASLGPVFLFFCDSNGKMLCFVHLNKK